MSSLDAPREENLVPLADSANNLTSRDVQGNKVDAAVTSVGTTKSLMAYLKGVVNQVASILNGQTDIKGTGFVKDTHSLKNLKDLIAALNTTLAFKLQPDAILNQVAPEQNIWYTVLDTTLNALIEKMYFAQITTGETLEVKLTIDGTVYTVTGINATAGTNLSVFFTGDYAGKYLTTGAGSPNLLFVYAPCQCGSFKAEIRKTTANGTGNLRASISFAKL